MSMRDRLRIASHASAACVHARAPSQTPVKRVAAVSIDQALPKRLFNLAAAGLVCLASAGPSCASSSKIGEFSASGLLFKDSVETVAIDDPEVSGVTIYISDFRRNIVNKLSPFGGDPSQASVTCALTGPIVIKDANRVRGQSGEEVYSEQRKGGLFMRPTLHVRRIFDEAHKTLLYVTYSTGLQDDEEESHGRYRTSICALPISSQVAPVEQNSANESSGLLS